MTPADSRQGGFSLVELLVSMALMALAGVAGWTLWDDAVHLMAAAGRAQRNPSFAPLSCQLRHDVHAATGLGEGGAAWTPGPLTLLRADGGAVLFELDGDRLWRVVEDSRGRRHDRRRLTDGVVDWRWRETRRGLIDVRVGLSLVPGPERVLGRRTSTPAPPPETVHRTLRLALRNPTGGGL
jgi:general secretion pathway protein J